MAIIDLLLIPVWCVVLTILHESGHAIAGRILGFKIFWIRIGHGRRLAEASVLGTKVKLNLGLVSGATMLASPRSEWIRLRWWLAVFAGPASHLAALLLICFLAGPQLIRDRLGSLWIEDRPSALAALFTLNGLCCLLNLLPLRMRLSKDRPLQPWDGYRLVTIPFLGRDAIAQFRALYHVLEATDLLDSGCSEDALRQCREAISLDPGNVGGLVLMAVAFARLGNWRDSRDIDVDLLRTSRPLGAGLRDTLKNNIAWHDLLISDPELLPEADAFSAEALAASPDKAHFQGTRGAVLVKLGNLDEGIQLLKTAYSRHRDPRDSASVAFWLGIAEARRGNYQDANHWIKAARGKCPNHEMAEMADAEVAAAGIGDHAAPAD